MIGNRKGKYNNKRVTYYGITFDSAAEGRRYLALRKAEERGVIRSLKCQPVFPIHVADTKICNYIADFFYLDGKGRMVVEDVKGVATAVYKIKRKLFEALYPEYIFREIKKDSLAEIY